MPRYFFDIFNDIVTIDDVGVELADKAAARDEVRKTFPAMLRELKPGRDASQLRVDVRDEAGTRVVAATVVMVIECMDDRHRAREREARR